MLVVSFESSKMVRQLVFVRLISLARMLRLLRLLRHVLALSEFDTIREGMATMAPAAARVGKLLFVSMYFFAVFGTQRFGGLINSDPATPSCARLRTTAFFAADYTAINFNDYPSGFVLLFCVLVVNNWFVLAEGFVAVAHKPLLARVYFVAWFVVGVTICVNVATSFVIDSFLQAIERRPTTLQPLSPRSALCMRRVQRSSSDVVQALSLSALSSHFRPSYPSSNNSRSNSSEHLRLTTSSETDKGEKGPPAHRLAHLRPSPLTTS